MESEGLIVITVTHDYNETLKNADKVVVLNKGKLVQVGTPQQLYAHPKNLYVAGLLGEYNQIKIKRKTYFVRPEQVLIKPKAQFSGLIKSSRFCGHFIELSISYEEEEITAFVSKDFDSFLEGKIHFDIPLACPFVTENEEII